MGSLNDYGRDRIYEREPRRLRGRLLRQCALAAVFFCAVAALINSEGPLGNAARYVAGPGLAAESSWVDWSGGLAPAEAAPGGDTETAGEGEAPAAGATPAEAEAPVADATPSDGETPAAAEGETPAEGEVPQFTAPASGVVVSDLSVNAEGAAEQQGILIQGSANQKVRAAAAGTVRSVTSESGGFRLELTHAAGFASVYQGLSQVDVAAGDQVALGDLLGTCAGGQLTFSLLRQGGQVDPLEYLFN